MKWPKRKEKIPNTEILKIQLGTIKHEVQKMPDPSPDRAFLQIYNDEGQHWQLPPFYMKGQPYNVAHIPLSFLTNRAEDNAKQIKVELRYEYNQGTGY